MPDEPSIRAIESGTVIDHIPAGRGLKVARLLKLDRASAQVVIGLNLDSPSLGKKDLLKIEKRELSEQETSKIAVYAPEAMITIVRDFKVVEKRSVEPPNFIQGLVDCPNQRCITNHSEVETGFAVAQWPKAIFLTCRYCERRFAL